MRRIGIFIGIVLMMTVFGSVVTGAEEVISDLVMKAGQKVWLFHSGTPDVKNEICLDDVIPVYREVKEEKKRYQVVEVGKVKVLSYQGKNYFEAQVVSGAVKVGDVVTKKAASCLVLPPR